MLWIKTNTDIICVDYVKIDRVNCSIYANNGTKLASYEKKERCEEVFNDIWEHIKYDHKYYELPEK